uniref:Uncharacterized protein n=1 Tax=Tanacetum cinerariifolium TaxID=118510 RepID=A0A6L2NBS0_TANCI|nr:hypothetical protein [Tanacetum cinerariifolium]
MRNRVSDTWVWGRRVTWNVGGVSGTIQVWGSVQEGSCGGDTVLAGKVVGDVRYGEAFPTITGLDAGQDRENIAKTSAMPHEASTRVTSLGGGEGKSRLLMIMRRGEKDLLRRMLQHREMDQKVDLLVADTMKDSDKSDDKRSDSTDDMENVLGTLGAANILASRGLRSVFTTASLSVATASTIVSSAVAIANGSFPTAVIFTTASVATPTTRVTRSSRGVFIKSSSPISVNIPFISKKDKGKRKMTEPLEQMNVQLARDLEAKFAQEDQIIREQVERDSEIARIHVERELEIMIAELDRSNEMVAKYLSAYEQAKAGLSHDEKVELIDEILMYQRHISQIKKYQAQQNKPATKTKKEISTCQYREAMLVGKPKTLKE